MASTLSVSKIQGLSTAASPTTIEIASGHKITGAAGALNISGTVLQVLGDSLATQLTTASTTFITTGVSVDITPSSSSNKIAVFFGLPTYAAVGSHFVGTIYRDSTNLGNSNWGMGFGSNSIAVNVNGAFFDSPNTTSQVTYAIYCRSYSGTGYAMINNAMASLTVMEIAQ